MLEKNIDILLENAPKALRNQLLRRLAAMAPGSTLKVMKNGKARRWRERERERDVQFVCSRLARRYLVAKRCKRQGTKYYKMADIKSKNQYKAIFPKTRRGANVGHSHTTMLAR